MKIEITKEIANHKIGDVVDKGDAANAIYIKKGFAKEVDKPELTANEVAELIAKCESLEDLKQFEGDNRQIVNTARSKKLKELK